MAEGAAGGKDLGEERIETALEELLKNHSYVNDVIRYCQHEYTNNPNEVFTQTKGYTQGKLRVCREKPKRKSGGLFFFFFFGAPKGDGRRGLAASLPLVVCVTHVLSLSANSF